MLVHNSCLSNKGTSSLEDSVKKKSQRKAPVNLSFSAELEVGLGRDFMSLSLWIYPLNNANKRIRASRSTM